MKILGFSLPDIKLPDIKLDKNLLSKGIDLLKGVAKDMFTPAQDGKNIFKDKLDINLGGYHLRLNNPLQSLGEKLLGGLASKLQSYGFNLDALTRALGGKRDVAGVGDVTLPGPADRGPVGLPDMTPPATDRTPMPAVPGSAPVGGGTSTSATASTSSTPSASAPAATASVSTPTVVQGADYTEKAINAFGGNLDSLEGQINSLMAKGDKLTETDSIKIQQAMQKRQLLFNLMTQIMQMEHETKKQIINNLR